VNLEKNTADYKLISYHQYGGIQSDLHKIQTGVQVLNSFHSGVRDTAQL